VVLMRDPQSGYFEKFSPWAGDPNV
jgi:hypothetical protein